MSSVSSVAEPLIVVQHNVQDGGLSTPTPGQFWDRKRLDAFIEFILYEQAEHGMGVLLQQEACWYRHNDHALQHEIENVTGLRGFLAPGRRALDAGKKDHPTAVWVDPVKVPVLGHVEHSGGTWWHGATQVRVLAHGHALNMVSTHLNVASPVLREGEGAALTMIGGLLVVGADANSARATGRAQSMTMTDLKHRAHRAASPLTPDEPDRAFARYLEFAGLVEVHSHIGTEAAMRWTTGHRRKHGEEQGGGSHADHGYAHEELIDGTVGEVTDCVVITEEEFPGIEQISDHLPSRWEHRFTVRGPITLDRHGAVRRGAAVLGTAPR